MKKLELLAPVGDKERLEAAVYFGADAVYFAGKKFGLRALASNFDENEIKEAVEFCHEHNVKVYITVNILAHNADFTGMVDYLKYLVIFIAISTILNYFVSMVAINNIFILILIAILVVISVNVILVLLFFKTSEFNYFYDKIKKIRH